MIRKMTKEEQEAHLSKMFSNIPSDELKTMKSAVETELLRREIKETENALSGKFVIVDEAALKIMQ
jgi:hypothetical protein